MPGATTVYARVPLFDLKKYTPAKFPPGGRVLSAPVAGIDNINYQLDERRRPITMSMRHSVNGVSWRGRYRYAGDEAEYVDFCVETAIPAQYSRAVFHQGQPVSFQRLTVNSGGSSPVWQGLDSTKRFQEIRSNPYWYFVWVEEYDVRDGLVRSGRAFTEGMGGEPTNSMLSYAYSENGRLQRITREYPSGRQVTEFAARASVSMRELSTTLSQRIAGRAMDALSKVSLAAPSASVELLYRSVTNYVPMLLPLKENDSLADSITRERMIELLPEDFEPEMADFLQRVESSERYEAATKMLRNAAKLLTKLNAGLPSTAPGFVAFAIDWEFEGHDLRKVLKDCGADSEALRIWRDRGWLD